MMNENRSSPSEVAGEDAYPNTLSQRPPSFHRQPSQSTSISSLTHSRHYDDSNEITVVSGDSMQSAGNATVRSNEIPAPVTGSMNNLVELSVVSVRYMYFYRHVTVELLMFLFFLLLTLTYPVMTAQYLVHTCRYTMGFNATTCAAFEGKTDPVLETLVQPQANIYIMVSRLIENCIPAVLTLFVGPWTDKHGRKTFLTAPLLGYVLKYLLSLVFSLFPCLPPAYLLIASIPVSLSGGMISVISLSYCYITDITVEQHRGFRMGILEACSYVGLVIGTASSTYLFKYGGYVAVYGTACAFCLLAFVYGVFFLPESVQSAKRGCILKLFDCQLVKEMVSTCTRKRDGGGRAIIFLTVATLALAIMTISGEGDVQFQFTREKFGWTMKDYTTYDSAGILMHTVGTLLAVTVLSRWLGIGDTPLAIGSFVLAAVDCVICAVSPRWWYLYLASVVSLMSGGAGPFCRAILSKTVPTQDVGKVFSLLSSLEAVAPLVAGPLYTLVYNRTILWFPGTFFVMSAVILCVGIIMLCVVLVIQRRAQPTPYTSLLAE